MTLKDIIDKDVIQAMKDQESLRLSTLRMIKAEILKIEKTVKGKSVSDEEVIQTLVRMIKQREESIRQYTEGGRSELARRERDEIAVIRTYLPEAVSENVIASVVKAVISEIGATSKKEMGVVMKMAMARLKESGGLVDGKVVNQVVGRLLQ